MRLLTALAVLVVALGCGEEEKFTAQIDEMIERHEHLKPELDAAIIEASELEASEHWKVVVPPYYETQYGVTSEDECRLRYPDSITDGTCYEWFQDAVTVERCRCCYY